MRFLLAWELGNNFGHASILVELALAIARLDPTVEIVFAAQQPDTIRRFASGFDFTVLPAPFCSESDKPEDSRFSPAKVFSDELWRTGYSDPQVLADLVRAWSELFDRVQPDLLVVQAAPTALLAAHPRSFRVVGYGHCYENPPRSEPMPPLRYWENDDPAELRERESAVLDVINAAMALLQRPAYGSFAQAIRNDAEFLATYAELEHYPYRRALSVQAPRYYGGIHAVDKGEALTWNEGAGKRIFAYVRPFAPSTRECLQALNGLSSVCDVILVCPGIPETLKQAIEKPHLRVFTDPVKLSPILPDCDIGISHAPQGTTGVLARYGVPQLLLPGHVEQFMGAQAACRQGLGIALWGEFGPDQVLEAMTELLRNRRYRDAAAAFSHKYRESDPRRSADAIASDLFTLVS